MMQSAQAASDAPQAHVRARAVEYSVRLDTPGRPVMPYTPAGVRACTSPTSCVELFERFEGVDGAPAPRSGGLDSTTFFGQFERGEKLTLTPWMLRGDKEITGDPVRVTTGRKTNLGRLRLPYDRPTGMVNVRVDLVDGKKNTWPFVTFCRPDVEMDDYCPGGGRLVLRKQTTEQLRVATGDWSVVTGYYQNDFVSDSFLESRIGSEPRTVTVRSGGTLNLTERARVQPRGKVDIEIDVVDTAGFFDAFYSATVVVELCRGYDCGTTSRVFVASAGTTSLTVPVAVGAWKMRAWIEDNCQSVIDRASSQNVTVTRKKRPDIGLSFTVDANPNPDGC